MADPAAVKVTYYLDLTSSWCFWAEPTWEELRRRFASLAEFEWRIALLEPSALAPNRDLCDWFYRRSGTLVRSPIMLRSEWMEPDVREYLVPNLVAEAAKDLGLTDDRVRLAITRKALVEGCRVSCIGEVSRWAADAGGLDVDLLSAHARTPGVERRVRETTEEFRQLSVTQRPTFVLENDIGDRSVVSGLVAPEPLVALVEAMLRDSAGYRSFAAHFGPPPIPVGNRS